MTDAARPLDNLHALVSGGGKGIGAAVARRLAGMGASVTLVGRTPEPLRALADELAGQHPQPFHAAPADMTDGAQVERAFASARAALGPIALLVNNAGGVETKQFLDLPAERWQALLDVNLTSTAHGTRHALPDMLEKGWGRIVNVASIAGVMGVPYVTAYVAAKHAVVGLTRALALEVAKKGVTVNAVCPGYVDTDMTVRSVQALAESVGRSEEVMRALLIRDIPIGRMLTPEEVASAVCWLCHPEQAMVTGHALVLSGGEAV